MSECAVIARCSIDRLIAQLSSCSYFVDLLLFSVEDVLHCFDSLISPFHSTNDHKRFRRRGLLSWVNEDGQRRLECESDSLRPHNKWRVTRDADYNKKVWCLHVLRQICAELSNKISQMRSTSGHNYAPNMLALCRRIEYPWSTRNRHVKVRCQIDVFNFVWSPFRTLCWLCKDAENVTSTESSRETSQSWTRPSDLGPSYVYSWSTRDTNPSRTGRPV